MKYSVKKCSLTPKIRNPNLHLHKDLSEFLDLHNKDAEEHARAVFVEDLVTGKFPEIKRVIEKEFTALGFIVLDEDADVEDVTVDEIEFGQVSIVALHA